MKNAGNKIPVIIPDAETDLTLKVVRCLGKEQTLFPILLAKNLSIPVKFSKYCGKVLHDESKDEPSHIERIREIAGNNSCVLLPVTLKGFQFVAKNKAALSRICKVPPIPEYDRLVKVSDKWTFHDIARTNNLPVLPSYPLDENMMKCPISDEMAFPLLLKSRKRAGGSGFQIAANQEEWARIYDSIRPEERSEYLVQQFIDGIDYSLSVFCIGGEIVSYTLWRALSYGAKKYAIPTVVEFVSHEKILTAGKTLMRALQWEGVADIDFFAEKHGERFWLLEINARFWQTVVACLPAGVNFPVLNCLAALGRPLPEQKQRVGLIYARPSGVPSLIKDMLKHQSGIKLSNIKTGYGALISDPLPELVQGIRRARGR